MLRHPLDATIRLRASVKLKRDDFNMLWGSCVAQTLLRDAENPVWLACFWPDEEARQVSRSVLQNLKAFRSMHKMKKVRSWMSGFPLARGSTQTGAVSFKQER